MAQELEISVGSVHTIIRNCLGMREVSAVRYSIASCQTRLNVVWKWLPLIFHGSIRRVKTFYQDCCYWWNVGEVIRARAEKKICWVAYFKRTAACKVSAKLKMFVIFAYDIRGVLTTHKVPSGKTVNGEYYKEYIQKCLRPAIRKKPPELLAEGLILLHDNATPHKAGEVTSLIDSYNWEILVHPSFSPDISLCDYNLFPKLKNMRGTRCSDWEDLEAAVSTQWARLLSNGYRRPAETMDIGHGTQEILLRGILIR